MENNIKSNTWSVTYRVQTLEDIVGADKAVATLRGYIKSGNIPSAILLSGPSGCGKTSIARIFAQMIQQETDSIDLSVKPADIYEKNMSDERGIDDARSLIEKIKMKPMSGKYKVFILDEVHALLKQTASAMLKPLEDAPDHVFWILCTDQPGSLLTTIRNRCQQIQLDPPGAEDIYKLLRRVVKLEKVRLNKDPEENKEILKKLCKMVADNSIGQPREAIQTLQQSVSAIIGSGEKVSVDGLKDLVLKTNSRLFSDNPIMLPTDLSIALYNGDVEGLIKRAAGAETLNDVLRMMILNAHLYLCDTNGGKIQYNWFYGKFKSGVKSPSMVKAIMISLGLNDIQVKLMTLYQSNPNPLILAELAKLAYRVRELKK